MITSKKVELGQYFTPEEIVNKMISLMRNKGRTLEPSVGDGAFFYKLENCVGIEIDKTFNVRGVLTMDFFDYPCSEKFDTIIGNPPYVAFSDIVDSTKSKLDMSLFDRRSNLYLFFIEKSIRHLNNGGELIFIVPRDFFKSTSAIKLNELLFCEGAITDFIDLSDTKVFKEASPDCIIFRFEKGNHSKICNGNKKFNCLKGQIFITSLSLSVSFSDIFSAKVGAVTGNDFIFKNEQEGNVLMVNSKTAKSGKPEKYIRVIEPTPYLRERKQELINRKVKNFNEKNWWKWGRECYESKEPRIYVNCKTRNKKPFFFNDCKIYDGSVLALFPKLNVDLERCCEALNNVNWKELGFVSGTKGGRYIFSQKSLENCYLPEEFLKEIKE